MADFAGRRCFVTGAASGLGREVARRLGAEGARLCLVDHDPEGLAAAAAETGAEFSEALDVSDDVAAATVARRLGGAFGAVDVLVNAAGILGPSGSIADCEEADWDRVFAVNVKGTYLMIRRLLPLIRAAGGGAIVNFASTAGLAGSATLGAYSASKGAVVMMTRSLAIAHAAEGVRVNCVCPGSIDTPMLERTFASAGGVEAQASRREMFRMKHPMLRFGEASEIADAVLFLASDAASFITGVALPVDGGRLA